MDGLALQVVVGMGLAVGSGEGLRRFIGLEAEIALLVIIGAGFVAEAGVAEHQVVVGLQIFGIDRKRLLEFLDGIGVAFLQKEDAAKFVVDHAVARILSEYGSEHAFGFVVLAFIF